MYIMVVNSIPRFLDLPTPGGGKSSPPFFVANTDVYNYIFVVSVVLY